MSLRGAAAGVVFRGRDTWRRNEFRGNDFREADLIDVAFRAGIDLDAQLLPPAGETYVRLRDLNGRVHKARREVKRWPDEQHPREALRMLEVVESVFDDEGPDVFTRRDFVIGMTDRRELGERVLHLLERAGDDTTPRPPQRGAAR